MGLVDGDTVDFSNLQRQILHGTKDVGRKKLNSARDRIREINPNVQVDLYDTFFTSANAREIVEPYDIVIDGTDNFPTRYLLERHLRLPEKAERLRLDFPLRRPVHRLRAAPRRAVLPLHVSRAAAAGHGAELRGRRRARRAARASSA